MKCFLLFYPESEDVKVDLDSLAPLTLNTLAG